LFLSRQDILFLQNRVAYLRDEQSYKKLFYHFHIPLHRFACKMVKNAAVADEIVSDTMMKVWAMDNKLAQVDRLNQYLFTAVKNAALSYLSKNKAGNVPLDQTLENTFPDKDDNPENRLIVSEIGCQVEQAIAALPPQCQLVYRLIKEEGFSHKEVCAILEVSQNTVETQMRIALKKIRWSLEAYLRVKK
jgi:RNA polymerase sigma-70 factor (family 1)